MDDPLRIARTIIDALDEAALLIDREVVRLANQAARDLLGPRAEGHDVRFAIRHPRVLEHILARREAELDVVGIGDLGRTWRVTIRPLEGDLVFVRLSDRSLAVSAERMRVDFVANASHELRTPLSAVLGYAETLADDSALDQETVTRFGGTIASEAQRMLRIVEDLMSLSRIEADRFVAPADSLDIAAVVEDAVADAGTARQARQCEVKLIGAEGLPQVRGDRAQLVQMFDNLISNAVRYGCDAPGYCVEIRFTADDGRLTVAVIDRGPGIAREHLPRLTERFYRVDDARSRESGGTGLGLAIVKHIVERHRGSLDIDSTPGVGTTVTVGLPIAR